MFLTSSSNNMIFRILLIFVPLTIIARLLNINPVIVFVLAFIAIIPLASMLGEATEVLAHFTGPKIGGMLNATLGTLTEIIVLFALLRSGQIDVLKASIVGGILLGLLVAVGLSLLMGGLKYGIQQFDRVSVGAASATMMLAVVGLMVPTFFSIGSQIEVFLRLAPTYQEVATDESEFPGCGNFVCSLPAGRPVPAPHAHRGTAGSSTGIRNTQVESADGNLVLVGVTIAIAIVGEILSGALGTVR